MLSCHENAKRKLTFAGPVDIQNVVFQDCLMFLLRKLRAFFVVVIISRTSDSKSRHSLIYF